MAEDARTNEFLWSLEINPGDRNPVGENSLILQLQGWLNHACSVELLPFRASSGDVDSKDKSFHGQCETLFFVGTGHKPGLVLHF